MQQIADVLVAGRSSVCRALWREGAVHGPTPRSVPAPDESTAGRSG